MIRQNFQPKPDFVSNWHLLREAYQVALRVEVLYTDNYAS